MSRKLVNSICRRFSGAEVFDPWAEDTSSGRSVGKIFACSGAIMPGVSVKTDSIETTVMLIDAGVGVKARPWNATLRARPREVHAPGDKVRPAEARR